MSCKRLDIMECHCHGGRQLKKYSLIDCMIDYNVSSHFVFYYFTLYDMISVAILVLQMPTKIAVFYEEEKQFFIKDYT